MLTNRDVIVFGDDWGYYPSTMQHIGRVLARSNRLLWIGSLGLRRPRLTGKDVRRAWGKARRILRTKAPAGSGSQTGQPATGPDVPPSVFLCHPLVIPFHDNAAVRAFNAQSLRRTVAAECARLGFRQPVLITSNPMVAPLLGHFGETSAHYICLDDFTLFEGAFRCIASMERDLLRKVNSVFSVSEILQASRRPASGEGHFLPQGVDIEHFSPTQEPLTAPAASLRKPVIGFFGLVTSWVDIELLRKTAAAYPDCTVAVIGRSAVDVRGLQGVPNLAYLGEVPYKMLPQYARAFDVGLIPFVVNELTRAANPLKLLEYLSLGIPVVSTDLPEVRRFAGHTLIARSAQEFISMVGIALKDQAPHRAEDRRATARSYSWSILVDRMSEDINRIESSSMGTSK